MTTETNINIEAAPNTGKLLQDYFAKKRIRKNALSRVIRRNISTLVKFLKNDTIQTRSLWDICFALKHNFFMDIADLLPKEFSSDAIVDNSLQERIIELERENEILRAERDLLERIVKK